MMRPFSALQVPTPKIACPAWPEVDVDVAIDLEIGAGAGLHALAYARSNPNRHLIAIERTEKFLQMKGRLDHHQHLENLTIIRADAINWLVHNSSPQSIERIFILYPNPYPKGRHANLRWHNMAFMSFLLSRLKWGGELTLATNEEFYHLEARDSFVGKWNLELVEDRIIANNTPPRTHFERKYLRRGSTCWNLIFKYSAASK